MDSGLWRRLEPILDRALELKGPERDAYVQAVCSAEPALRKNLEAMLAADAEEGGVLDCPAAAFLDEVERATEAERARTGTLKIADEDLERIIRRLLRQRSRARDAGVASAPEEPISGSHGRFLSGAMVAGRYRIVARVGRGGMVVAALILAVAVFGFRAAMGRRRILPALVLDP